MSWKSMGLSILSLVVTIGLLFATSFLFMLNIVLGIIGIVLLFVIPNMIGKKAKDEATGVVDKIFAKYIVPAATVIIAGFVVMIMLGMIPSPC